MPRRIVGPSQASVPPKAMKQTLKCHLWAGIKLEHVKKQVVPCVADSATRLSAVERLEVVLATSEKSRP